MNKKTTMTPIKLRDKSTILVKIDDIVDFDCFEKGKEKLGEYNVEF